MGGLSGTRGRNAAASASFLHFDSDSASPRHRKSVTGRRRRRCGLLWFRGRRRSRCGWRGLSAPLNGEIRKKFLASLECVRLCAGGALRVHREPHRPDHHADNASRDILRDFHAVFFGEFLSLHIVGVDLGADHCAVAVLILRLHNRDGVQIATSTSR
jgi:hypothetical protein